MAEKKNLFRSEVGKPKGKEELGIPGYILVNIQTDIKEIGSEGEYWIQMAQDKPHCLALWTR
jgi:hypothetical protein